MDFTVDWIGHHAETWRNLLRMFNPEKILEVGSCEGRSACFFINNCPRLHDLHCLDTWDNGNYFEVLGGFEQRFMNNINEALRERKIKLTMLKGKSHIGLASLIAEKENYFDVAYIDASHVAEDVLTDAVLAYRLVREGGLIMFDDYAWYDPNDRDVLARPKIAIDAFSNVMANHLAPVVLGDQSQMYFVKMNHRAKK